MTHDYDAQRAETFATFDEIGRIDDLPKRAEVNFLFLADDLDPPFEKAGKLLQNKGFRTEVDAEGETLEARIGPVEVSAEAIWDYERQATELVLPLGFEPDGWEIVE